ncbi:hypothetical protein U27_06615 [Candidatus Vecturithrix granuli]|uniref:Uncharacterized protein n=1 Tax=Vecturithrix granuli TaxID=1499967 RepID=A0A081C4X5_VECG1|nr:hypothetical protein U27_06615 [Candidatus Vecturithrix granuli]
MYAIEFHTTITNGIIEVPHCYLSHIAKHVKVIVLMEETQQKTGLLAQLLQTPLKLEQFTPLTREEIYEHA